MDLPSVAPLLLAVVEVVASEKIIDTDIIKVHKQPLNDRVSLVWTTGDRAIPIRDTSRTVVAVYFIIA